MKQLLLILIACLIFQIKNEAQQLQCRYNNSEYALLDEFVYKKGSGIHTSIKPYAKWKADSIIDLDTVYNINASKKSFYWIANKNFIEFEKNAFWFTVNPLINFELAKERDDFFYKNTRGIQIESSIGDKFAFYTAFKENQGRFPEYMNKQIIATKVIPGQGLRKIFDDDAYDYSSAEGYISYSPSQYFNFKFGHGKNFLGDGYNSLLLSDRAFNYPHLKITSNIWNITYVNLFAQFMDIDLKREHIQGFQRKNAAIHYLSWNATTWLNISLFESIIWESGDSTYQRGFDFNYINPVIFYRPVEFSLGSPDNAMMGLNIKLSPLKNTHMYSQIILDEFKLTEVIGNTGWWANKSGFQAGIKSYHRFSKNTIFVQGEYSTVRPFTYSHFSTHQSYGHYNEPLAHPLGANFKEALFQIKYTHGRFQVNAMLKAYKKGIDSTDANSWGGDIFKPYTLRAKEYNNFTLQGIVQEVNTINVFASYLINYKYNLNITAGVLRRKETINNNLSNNTFVYLALRTSLSNIFNY